MASCRCSCGGYSGRCDCHFDGETQGRQRGEDETVKAIVAWLRARVTGNPGDHDEAVEEATMQVMALSIEQGDWRP